MVSNSCPKLYFQRANKIFDHKKLLAQLDDFLHLQYQQEKGESDVQFYLGIFNSSRLLNTHQNYDPQERMSKFSLLSSILQWPQYNNFLLPLQRSFLSIYPLMNIPFRMYPMHGLDNWDINVKIVVKSIRRSQHSHVKKQYGEGHFFLLCRSNAYIHARKS